jgi:hypothetical protein
VTGAQSGQVEDARADLFEIGKLGLDVAVKNLSGGRKTHARGQPFEDRRAQFVLQRQHAPIQRRGRNG